MNQLQHGTYENLIKNISATYEHARRELVRAYWEIGRQIVEAEQNGEIKAQYGGGLIKSLVAELSAKYGAGFSKSNLERMRFFYVQNRIAPTSGQLSWSHYVELFKVKDAQKRQVLAQAVADKKLPVLEVRRLVKQEALRDNGSAPAVSPKQLSVTRGTLWTYREVMEYPVAADEIVLDCGFHVIRVVSKSACGNSVIGKMNYTYAAHVERVVDGDTLRLEIDCGFKTAVRQVVRLRGIDAPELGTPEGERVKRWLTKHLKRRQKVVIRTYATDVYHRYIADLFYLPGCDDPVEMLAVGKFLNQELLDRGMAR